MDVRLKLLNLLCAMLILLAAGVSHAEVVRDLYAAKVPVASQSSKVLSAAARKALAEVLVKVSGSDGLLKNPVIGAALAKPRSNVLQYAYIRSEAPGGGLKVQFEFDPTYITELLMKAGAPLWTANRPLVLAWVVVDGEQGRYFVNHETEPEQAQQLVDAFSRRGVPLQLPLFDLTDTAAVSLKDAWRRDGIVIQSASARYQVQDVIVGRLASLSEGKSTGDWSYFYRDDRINRSVTAPDLGVFVRAGANIVADQMAARYAIAPSEGDGTGLRMSVTGVRSYADYAAIVSWLEGLELIQSANVEQVQEDRIELRLMAQAQAAQLASIIELNTRLLPVPVPIAGSEMAAQLSYQWQN
jgi:hypothetical protein